MPISLRNKLLSALTAILLLAPEARAQTVNGIPITEIETEYIQLMATTKLLSTKVTVDIDFGQRNKAFALRDTEIRDEKNQVVTSNSIIDALNFMSTNGYEFVQAYTVNISNTVVYYYVMRKKNKYSVNHKTYTR